ncbi:MAG: TatD family hydrolase [Treponemataceae bacterium]
MIYVDCHLHLTPESSFMEESLLASCPPGKSCSGLYPGYLFCPSCHSLDEIKILNKNLLANGNFKDKPVRFSFGSYPQNPDMQIVAQLEKILRTCKKSCNYESNFESFSKICAVGECGFDLFDTQLKQSIDLQRQVFESQLELALQYDLPIVIHCRKAMHLIFEYVLQLKKLPAVLFHSFSGSYTEAQSLINKGINVFYSFGKSILNYKSGGHKNALECALKLPAQVLLTETDSPYRLTCKDIKNVFESLCELRNISEKEYEKFSIQLAKNFDNLFCKKT